MKTPESRRGRAEAPAGAEPEASGAPAAGGEGAAAGEIRGVIEAWARATREDDRNRVLINHEPGVVIFDVLPPLRYEGADDYRASWDEWQPETEGQARFDLHDLEVFAGEGIAFAHGLIHCGGTLPDGRTFEDWVRATFGLRRHGGKWRIAHQHISMPRS